MGRDRGGQGISGINFAAQDYLNLASHPRILAAASAAGRRFGVHSAGTAVQMGLNPLTTALEDQLATFLRYEDATVFPSGWAAGYGAIRTLMREGDHVLIDTLAHDCLREGAAASGARVHRMRGTHFVIERPQPGPIHTDGEVHTTDATLDVQVTESVSACCEPSTVTAVTSKKGSPAASISSWSMRSGALPLE